MKITERIPNKEVKITRELINGVKLYCECTGNSGESFVLVHGSWVDHQDWDAVVPALSQSYRVLTYDRRGHSQSERPGSTGNIREDVADLAALIEKFQMAPANIVGNSYGGSIAMRLAEEKPSLIKTLIVHEPPLFALLSNQSMAPVLKDVKERISAVAERLEAGRMEEGARLFIETIAFGPGTWKQLPPELKEKIIFNAPTFLDELHDEQCFTIELTPLKDFIQPVLLTSGKESPPFFLTIMEKLAATFPQVELKSFAGAGHGPEQTHPEEYVSSIKEFIRKV